MNSHIDRQIIQTVVISVSFHLILLHVNDMSMHIINLSSKQLSFVIKFNYDQYDFSSSCRGGSFLRLLGAISR